MTGYIQFDGAKFRIGFDLSPGSPEPQINFKIAPVGEFGKRETPEVGSLLQWDGTRWWPVHVVNCGIYAGNRGGVSHVLVVVSTVYPVRPRPRRDRGIVQGC